MAVEIRPAGPRDVPVIVQMGMRFWRESRYSQMLDADPNVMAQSARTLMDNDNSVILLACIDTIPVGMLGLAAHRHFISDTTVVSELFWWVEPEYRGSIGLRLLKAGETWARRAGASKIAMVAPDEKIAGLYGRLRYTRGEISYYKELDNGSVDRDTDRAGDSLSGEPRRGSEDPVQRVEQSGADPAEGN